MNALPFQMPILPKMTVAVGDCSLSAEGFTEEAGETENGENAAFSVLFDMMVVPPMAALPVAPVDGAETPLPVAGTGKILPPPLPLLPEATVEGDVTAASTVPLAVTREGVAAPELLSRVVEPEAAAGVGKQAKVDPVAEPATVSPTIRVVAAKPVASDTAPQQAPVLDVDTPAASEPEAAALADTPKRPEAAAPARIMTAQNGAEMQVQFPAPQVSDAKALPASTHATPPAERVDGFQGPQRLEELVQAIAHARETGSQPVRATISHAEFGVLALKLTREDGGVSAQIASGDAAFAPAAHAAVRAASDAALAGQQRGDDQPRHHGAAPEQGGAQAHSQAHGSAQAGGQTGSGQPRQHSRADLTSSSAHPDDSGELDRPQRRSTGLYA